MFQNLQVNNSDSSAASSNINANDVIPPTIATRNTNVVRKQILQVDTIPKLGNDSTLVLKTGEKALFIVPYRCNLNRDSLKAELRKVVLEIDTVPQGLTSIITTNFKDTTQLKDPVFSKSLFTHHMLVPKGFELKPKVTYAQNWMAIVFMVVLFLIALLRVFYQKKFSLFINAFFSKRFSNQITREENALTQTTSVVLSIVFFIAISLFFYLANQYFQLNLLGQSNWQKFLLILLACVAFYLLKVLINKLAGYLFKTYKETDEYIFNQFLVLQILGLIIIIPCILLSYSVNFNKEIIIYFGFAVLILGFIIRMIKSFGISNMNTYSPVYIFLYLCTLEILPLIIIVKLIV